MKKKIPLFTKYILKNGVTIEIPYNCYFDNIPEYFNFRDPIINNDNIEEINRIAKDKIKQRKLFVYKGYVSQKKFEEAVLNFYKKFLEEE